MLSLSGPSLFIWCRNNSICELSTILKIILFADDPNLLGWGGDLEPLLDREETEGGAGLIQIITKSKQKQIHGWETQDK